MSDWADIGRALLGSWPTQVASWGRDGINAYLAELQARDLTPDQALAAIRSHTGAFPPSAGEITRAAVHDAGTPTFEEAYRLIYGARGILRARPAETSWASPIERARAYERAALERASSMHPAVEKLVVDQGVERLRMLEVDHEEYGELRRRELREAYERVCRAHRDRQVAALAAPRREGLRHLDPLAALGVDRPEIEAGRP